MPFGGRREELAELDNWLTDPKAPGNLLLTAPAAGGKSALLVHWIGTLNRAKWTAVFVPISIRYETNRPDVFFGALAHALAAALNAQLPVPAGDPAQFYRDTVMEYLDAWPDDARPCVVVVDGLDEATGWQLDTSILPPRPRANLRIVVSAREMANADAAEWERRIGWTTDRARVKHMQLGALSREDVHALLESVVIDGTVEVIEELHEALYRLSDGDPLLLQLYVRDVIEAQKEGRRIDIDALGKATPGFAAYFAGWMDQQSKVWETSKRTFDETLIKACLAILAVSAGPLRHTDLAGLVPGVLGHKAIVDAGTLVPIQRFLVGDGTEHGYAFSHPKFGIYVREEYLEHGPWIGASEKAFLEWGRGVVREVNAGALKPAEVPFYLLSFYFLHLKQADAPLDDWIALAQDGWRRAWEEVEDGMAGFARDVLEVLRRARSMALGTQSVVALGVLARCMLILSSHLARGSKVPAELLSAAVRTGVLTLHTAATMARARLEPKERSTALIGVAEHAKADMREALLHEAYEAASNCEDPAQRIAARHEVRMRQWERGSRLTPEETQELLSSMSLSSVKTFAQAWPNLSPQERSIIQRAVFAFFETNLNSYVARDTLRALRLEMPEAWVEPILDMIVQEKTSSYQNLEAQLVARLPAHRLGDVVTLAFPYRFNMSASKMETLYELGRRADPESCNRALAKIAEIHEVQASSTYLTDTLPQAPWSADASGSPSNALLTSVLKSAPGWKRLDNLIALLPLVAIEDARIALDEILHRLSLSAASSPSDSSSHDAHNAIEALLQAVPDALADRVIDLIPGSYGVLKTIEMLLPRLSPEGILRVRALQQRIDVSHVAVQWDQLSAGEVRLQVDALMNIADGSAVAHLEARAARVLAEDESLLCARALEWILQAKGSLDASEAIAALAPMLTHADCLSVIDASKGEPLHTILAMADCLPESALPAALAVLPAAGNPDRAAALIALAPRFAHHAAIEADLPGAVASVAEQSRYEWEKKVLRALHAMSTEQRLRVADLSREMSTNGMALRALLLEAETDDTARIAPLERLLAEFAEHEAAAPDESISSVSAISPDKAELTSSKLRLASAFLTWGGDLRAAGRKLFDLSPAIKDPLKRAEMLIALMNSGKLDEHESSAARRDAMLALQQADDPSTVAGLMVKGAKVLPAEERLTLQTTLLEQLDTQTFDDRMSMLYELLGDSPNEQLMSLFQSTIVEAISRALPDLAREFRDDVKDVVCHMTMLMHGIDLNVEGESVVNAFISRVMTLAAPIRWRLLVSMATVAAFAPRPENLGFAANTAEFLNVAGTSGFLREFLDNVREIERWYP